MVVDRGLELGELTVLSLNQADFGSSGCGRALRRTLVALRLSACLCQDMRQQRLQSG